jgi:hypothetical protein
MARGAGIHPLSVRDVVLANESQEKSREIIKDGRKRIDIVRGV